MLLRASAVHPDDSSALRRLPDNQQHMVWRESNHDVVQRIARMIVRRDLCLIVESIAPTSVTFMDVPAAARAPSTARTPSQVRSPAPEPESAPPPEQEEIELEQIAQAAALEEAAMYGVPFCEECEKQKQAQASHHPSA